MDNVFNSMQFNMHSSRGRGGSAIVVPVTGILSAKCLRLYK